MEFQFTPLREGRPVSAFAGSSRANFNSRPCVRGDSKTAQNCTLQFMLSAEKVTLFFLTETYSDC